MKKYRLKRPVLVALTAAVTAGVTLNLPAGRNARTRAADSDSD